MISCVLSQTANGSDPAAAKETESTDRTQSIFAVHNCTGSPQSLELHRLNLIATDQWRDLISGTRLQPGQGSFDLAPYQSVWITNA